MARTNVTITNSLRDGIDLTMIALDDSNNHEFLNSNGKTLLLVVNGLGGVGGGVVVFEVYSAVSRYGRGGSGAGDDSNISFSVGIGDVSLLGPFPPLLFNQTGDGGAERVLVDVDAASANCELAAIHISSA